MKKLLRVLGITFLIIMALFGLIWIFDDDTPAAARDSTPASASVTTDPRPANTAVAGKTIPVTIVNRTGFRVTEVYVSGSDEDWGANLLSGALQNNASRNFSISVQLSSFDIAIADENGKYYYKYAVKTGASARVEFTGEDLEKGASN